MGLWARSPTTYTTYVFISLYVIYLVSCFKKGYMFGFEGLVGAAIHGFASDILCSWNLARWVETIREFGFGIIRVMDLWLVMVGFCL